MSEVAHHYNQHPSTAEYLTHMQTRLEQVTRRHTDYFSRAHLGRRIHPITGEESVGQVSLATRLIDPVIEMQKRNDDRMLGNDPIARTIYDTGPDENYQNDQVLSEIYAALTGRTDIPQGVGHLPRNEAGMLYDQREVVPNGQAGQFERAAIVNDDGQVIGVQVRPNSELWFNVVYDDPTTPDRTTVGMIIDPRQPA